MIGDLTEKYLNSTVKRTDIINYLIKKNNFKNYLEIGVWKGENIELIDCEHKDGVDPGVEGIVHSSVNYPITSDAFFELINGHDIKYDLIFIDGLHHFQQVYSDILNSLNHLSDNGYIVLHDCNPVNYEAQIVPRATKVWNGDVWKAFVKFKWQYRGFDCEVVDTDMGVGIIKNSKDQRSTPMTLDNKLLDFYIFDKDRNNYLSLISPEEFYEQY